MAVVLETDFAWPDVAIERGVIEAAGHRLVTGPAAARPPEAIEALVAAHDPAAILICWAEVSAATIRAPQTLRIAQRLGVGLDNIAVEAATARGARVANVPDYCVEEVSDHAVALALAWFRGVVACDRAVKTGAWDPARARLRRGRALTAGILGLGRIGRLTARKLDGLGPAVLGHDIVAPPESTPARLVDPDRLAAEADIAIVHLPLTDDTRRMVDAAFLARLKPGAFLVNMSRGLVFDSDVLITVLDSGHLAGPGLDVGEGEPDPPAALVARPDVIATPHVAFSSDSPLAELRRRDAEEVVRVLAGGRPENPRNRVP